MKDMKCAFFTLIALTAFAAPLAGSDVIYHISNYKRMPQWPIVYADERGLAEAVAAYGSPEALMHELREAMRAKPEGNGAVHRAVWRFVHEQRHRLPFTEEDFEYFATWAGFERICYERNTSIACLAAGQREEALPVLRRMLEDDDAAEALAALEMASDYGPWLPEEDIDRVIVLLYDTRDIPAFLGGGRLYHPGDWFLAFHAMQTLAKVGPPAERARDVILEQLIHFDNYDAAKFAAFLEKISDPELTPETFWRLVDETGLKVKREYSEHENFIRRLTKREQFPGEARPLEPREEIKRDIGEGYHPALALLALAPDDPRGLFLLLEHMFSRYEITNTGLPMQFVDGTFLSRNRAFLPIIDLLLRHPEMVNTYLADQYFLRMPGDPKESWHHDTDLEEVKQIAVETVLSAAFECDLTEAECLRYVGIYLDMPEEVFSFDLAILLAEHQQMHRAALVALMKTRMAAEDEDSPAFRRAEEYLREVEE